MFGTIMESDEGVMKMKEINSKILDDFMTHKHQMSHQRFTYSLFQDVCHRISVDSAYSRYLNGHYHFDQKNQEKIHIHLKTDKDPG
jgi:hypothetical protein